MVNITGLVASVGLVGGTGLVVVGLLAAIQLARGAAGRWLIDLDLPDIAAFAPRYGYRVGTTIPLFVHANRRVTMTVVRLGTARTLFRAATEVAAIRQNSRYDVWNGCDWQQTAELPTAGWPPGVFLLEFTPLGGGTAFTVPLLLAPPEPRPIAVVCSTNTWEAYNAFGGLSNYHDLVTPRPLRWAKSLLMKLDATLRLGSMIFPKVPLPRRRPNIRIAQDLADCSTEPTSNHDSHLLRSDWNLIAFLERDGIDAAVFDDAAWERQDEDLLAARLIIFQSHAEYWTRQAVAQLTAFRKLGGSIAFLSGNNCWRELAPTPSGHCVVRQSVSRPWLAHVLGAAFDKRGYRTWAPYEVIDPDHWTLASTGLHRGASVGAISANCGRVDPAARFPGASGHEVDKISRHARGFSLIAAGRNPGAGASMVCGDSPDGSFLFNASSITFTGSLQLDPAVDSIVRALVRRAVDGHGDAVPHAKEPAPSPSPRVR